MDSETRIHGVLLKPGVRSCGSSGIEKIYREDVVSDAVGSAIDSEIVAPDRTGDDKTVGAIVDASYDSEEGLVYEGKLWDDDLVERIDKGFISVVPRTFETPISDCEEVEGCASPDKVEIRHAFMTMSPADASGEDYVEKSVKTISEFVEGSGPR